MEKDKLPKMSVSTMRVVGTGKQRDLSRWETVAPPPPEKKEPEPPEPVPPQIIPVSVKPRFTLPKVTVFRVQGSLHLTRAQKFLRERALRIRSGRPRAGDVPDVPLYQEHASTPNIQTQSQTSQSNTSQSKTSVEQLISGWALRSGGEATSERQPRAERTSSARVKPRESRKWGDARRPEQKQNKATWGERVLRNCAVVAAVVLCVLALKNIDSPVTRWATDSLKGMVTAEVNIDDQLGRLQFVQDWMPEAMQVFLSAGETEWAWPISGKLDHLYSAEEPWVEIVSQKQAVHAAADGEVLSVVRDQRGEYVVRLRHLYGYETVYANLSGVSVQEGDSITGGSAVGVACQENVSETLADGGTGTDGGGGAADGTGTADVSENRLYLEVRKDGIPANPMQIFPAARQK